MKNAIQIADDLTAAIVGATRRWSHRPKNSFGTPGGHYRRSVNAAIAKAENALNAWEFDKASIKQIIKDARDMAALELNAA